MQVRGDFAALRDVLAADELPVFTIGLYVGVVLAAQQMLSPGATCALLALGVCLRVLRALRPAAVAAGIVCSLLLGAACGQAAFAVRRFMLDAPMVTEALPQLTLCGTATALIRDQPIRVDLFNLVPKVASGVRLVVPRRQPLILPGERVCVVADLTPLPPQMLPGGYDFAGRMFYFGIGGQGKITQVLSRQPLDNFDQKIDYLRYRLRARLNAADPSGVLTALATGDRSGIAEFRNEEWRKAGIYHVISISGLHMAVLAGGTAALLRRLGVLLLPAASARGRLRRPIALMSVLPASAYLLLAGTSPPAMRSLLMTGFSVAAYVLNGRAAAARTLFLSAAVLLLLTPETAFDIGAQMSYSAVAAVVITGALMPRDGIGRARAWWRRALRYAADLFIQSAAVTLATAPLTAYTFNRLSFYGVIVNIIAVPVSGAWLMGGLTIGVALMPFGLEAPALEVAAAAVRVLNTMATEVAQWPFAEWRMQRPSIWLPASTAAASAVMLLALRRPRAPAVVALLLLLPLFAVPGERLEYIADAAGRNVLNVASGDFCLEKHRPYLIKTWRDRAGLRQDQTHTYVSDACTPPPSEARVLIAHP